MWTGHALPLFPLELSQSKSDPFCWRLFIVAFRHCAYKHHTRSNNVWVQIECIHILNRNGWKSLAVKQHQNYSNLWNIDQHSFILMMTIVFECEFYCVFVVWYTAIPNSNKRYTYLHSYSLFFDGWNPLFLYSYISYFFFVGSRPSVTEEWFNANWHDTI